MEPVSGVGDAVAELSLNLPAVFCRHGMGHYHGAECVPGRDVTLRGETGRRLRILN